jgi:hypothetical protein
MRVPSSPHEPIAYEEDSAGPGRLGQKAERQAVIYKLKLLGWTQEEIARVIGKDQSRVSRILCEIPDIFMLWLE